MQCINYLKYFTYPENDYNQEYDPCVPVEVDFLGLWRPGCRLKDVRIRRQAQLSGKSMQKATAAVVCRWVANYPRSFRQPDTKTHQNKDTCENDNGWLSTNKVGHISDNDVIQWVDTPSRRNSQKCKIKFPTRSGGKIRIKLLNIKMQSATMLILKI